MFSLFIRLASHTPLRLAWALGWWLAWLWWTVLPIRKRAAVANFRAALPALAPGPALRRMMAGLVLGYFELLGELRRPGLVKIDYRDFQPLLDHLASGQGAFFLAGHYGSWDLCGPMTNRDIDLPATTIVRVPAQPQVAALMERIRTAMKMRLLPPRDSMPEVYRQLSEGRLLVFLLDQRHNKGLPVPFFGRPAWTSPALAAAAMKTGLPVFPLHYYRAGIGRHVIEVLPPLELVGQVAEDTARLTACSEELIRQRPHNWLWLHERWRRP